MSEITTYCTLWTLIFSAGDSLHLTDHDAPITFDSITYTPQNSAVGEVSDSQLGLSVDSGGLRTSLTLSDVSTQDIRNGILDGAQLSEYRHDWRSGATDLIHTGRIGEVSLSGDNISVEWLGQASLLDASTGRVFSRQCDASFGDSRCGLNSDDFAPDTICPRSFAACRDQFVNTLNFRGFPYLLGDDVLQAGVAESDRRDGSSRYR